MLLSLGLLSSCTFFERAECTTNSDCTEAFGEGSICVLPSGDTGEETDGGFCSLCETNDDCQDAYGNGATCATREGRSGLFEFTEPKYCEVDLVPSNRCDISFPENIWNDWETYSDAVIIGQMFNGSADLSKTTATQIAIEKIQEVQADDERPFVSVLCNYSASEIDDDLNENDAIKAIVDHLADDFGVNVIIGPSSSSASLTALDNIDSRAIIISPSATSEDLTQRQQQSANNPDEINVFWRTVGSDNYQSAVLVELIDQKEQEAEANDETGTYTTKVGVLYTDQVYGLGILESLEEPLGEGVVEGFKFDNDTTQETLESIIQGAEGTVFEGVTSIVIPISDVGHLKTVFSIILDHNAETDDSRLYFFTDSAVRSEVFTEDIRDKISDNADIIDRIWGTRPAILEEGSPFSDFNSDFELLFTENLGETYDVAAAYKYSAENNIFAAYSYDAMWLGVLGSLWAQYTNNETPNGVVDGINVLSPQGSPGDNAPLRATEWSSFKDAFSEERALDVVGCSGDLDFHQMTGQINPKIEIWHIDENSKQLVFDECSFSSEEAGRNVSVGDIECPILLADEEEE